MFVAVYAIAVFADHHILNQRGLQDPAPQVALEALKALSILIVYLDEDSDFDAFNEAIPFMIKMVKKSAAEGDEESTVKFFEDYS